LSARRPEKTPLSKIVSECLESWLADHSARKQPVAASVEEEFRGYLTCGLLCSNHATPSPRPRLGAVSLLHRFGSGLNRHAHLHAAVTDGVCLPGPHGPDGLPATFRRRREGEAAGSRQLPARPQTWPRSANGSAAA